MKRTVHFYEKLKDMAGVDEFAFEVDTPLALINALNSQVKGFRKLTNEHPIVIIASNEDKTEYDVVGVQDFSMSFGKHDHIHIQSVPEGSGAEVAVYFLGAAAAGTAAFVAITIAVNLAISFVVSAIVKALAPSPDTSEGPAAAANRPSFIYNGAKLVYEQGYAIPLVYGTHMTGGICIYTDLVIEDIPYVPAIMDPPENGYDPLDRGDGLGPVDYQWGGGQGGGGS